MNLKLACADFTFPLLPHENTFDVIAMLGFQGIDVGLFDERSHLQPRDILPDLRGSARKLVEQVTGRGLEIADIFYQARTFETFAANHPDPAERTQGREFFLRMLEFTLRCNAKHTTALPGLEWDGVPVRDIAQTQRRGIVVACAASAPCRCHIFYRAAYRLARRHSGKSARTGTTISRSHVDARLHAFYAQGHSRRASGAAFRVCFPLSCARGAREGRIQAAFKENMIDYARILKRLNALNYSGYIGVEYTWIDWEHSNEVDNISETILMRDHLRLLAAQDAMAEQRGYD